METWTLITGASSGLGTEFARQSAALGQNLILTARRADRLEELKSELLARYPIQIEVIPIDLANANEVQRLINIIKQQEMFVETLINNAGFGAFGSFDVISEKRMEEMIQVNMSALSLLTHAFLGQMKLFKRGNILNVASIAGYVAGPYMAEYYASKAYVLSLTEALHEELIDDNIHVSALCPGPTKTAFFLEAGTKSSFFQNLLMMDAKEVCRIGLVSLANNKAIAVAGIGNLAFVGLLRLIPRTLATKIVGRSQQVKKTI